MPDLILKDSGVQECPKCHSETFIGCQYRGGTPESYDGVSEWICTKCGTRYGRWSKRELIEGEIERRYGRTA